MSKETVVPWKNTFCIHIVYSITASLVPLEGVGGEHYRIHICAPIGAKLHLRTTIYPEDKEKMWFYLQKPSFWELIKEH